MTGGPRSPRLARLILTLVLPERYRDNQIGDLEEEFRTRGREDGWNDARLWYWRQALTSLPGTWRLRYREEREAHGTRGGGWMERPPTRRLPAAGVAWPTSPASQARRAATFAAFEGAVQDAFPEGIDYTQLQKIFGSDVGNIREGYLPSRLVRTGKRDDLRAPG